MRNKQTVRPVASAASLLGSGPKVSVVVTPANDCVICGKIIPQERVDALQMLNTPRTRWAHTKCSQTQKIKGVYLGEVGTSQLQLCDKLYNDSVRSVFRKANVTTTDNGDEGEAETETGEKE